MVSRREVRKLESRGILPSGSWVAPPALRWKDLGVVLGVLAVAFLVLVVADSIVLWLLAVTYAVYWFLKD
jgi:hypothetical protein